MVGSDSGSGHLLVKIIKTTYGSTNTDVSSSSFKVLVIFYSEILSLKRAEKSSSTSFWVRAAPKSWSKYTTFGQINFNFVSLLVSALGARPFIPIDETTVG